MHLVFLLVYVMVWVAGLLGAVALGHHLTVRAWQKPRRAQVERHFDLLMEEYRDTQKRTR